ncbi:unnamed protein product, partial [Dovyalis caffra]
MSISNSSSVEPCSIIPKAKYLFLKEKTIGIGLIGCVSSLLHETYGGLLKKGMMILHRQVMIHPLQAKVQRLDLG